MKKAVLFESDEFPGQLGIKFDGEKPEPSILSQICGTDGVLANPYMYLDYSRILEEKGFVVDVDDSVIPLLLEIDNKQSSLNVDGFSIKRKDGSEGSLFPYQDLMLNVALNNDHDFFFFNAGTGTGKTIMSVAGMQELFNRGEIELALVFTLKSVRPDFLKAIRNSSSLSVDFIEGDKRNRKKKYEEGNFDVLVMNYEKARKNIDFEFLSRLVKEKSVLFVLDECQKILNNNQSRAGIDSLMSLCSRKIVWPLSASVVDGDPERFWKVFEWADSNPLGTLDEFRDRYVNRSYIVTQKIRMKNGHLLTREETKYEYDMRKLREVRHRVGDYSLVVRKSDPGVRENFKGLEFRGIPLEMSKQDREIYDLIKESAEEERMMEFYNALRWTCLSAESHLHTTASISSQIAEAIPTLSTKTSAKMERLLDDVEALRDGGDKCLIFTSWTNLSLKLISREMTKRGISHVCHHGGQTDSENEAAKQIFKSSPDVVAFLSSDAGSTGLNLPEARVVINYECPYSYDLLMQRNNRIDRADSELDGMEAWVYYYEDTCEEYIFNVNEQRRLISSATQGSTELLSKADSVPGMMEMRKIMSI